MAVNILNGLLLDCDYSISEKGFSVIQVYVSTKSGIQRVEDPNFPPYFYLLSKDPNATIKALEGHDFGEGAKILRAREAKLENASGVVQVFFKNPQDLVKARENVEQIEGVIEKREFDIPFANRYLIDNRLHPMAEVEVESENGQIKKIHSVEINSAKINRELRIAAIDLETYSPGRFSDPKKDPILMCVITTPHESRVYTYKKTSAKEAVVVRDEKELLETVLSDLRKLICHTSRRGARGTRSGAILGLGG